MIQRTNLLLASLLTLACAFNDGLAMQEAPVPAATAPSTPTVTLDLRRMQAIHGDAQAGAGKATVCAACHGVRGVGIAPTFPNLAGQSATYLYLQLKEFQGGERNDPVMTAQATALGDADMRDLASYFATMAPKPAGQGDADSRRAQLYLAGDPAKGVPPCQGCHGPTGMGPQPHASTAPQPAWVTFPRLRGQSSLYLVKQLTDYRDGARAGSSNAKVMQGVARTLDDADVQALAAYLSTF